MPNPTLSLPRPSNSHHRLTTSRVCCLVGIPTSAVGDSQGNRTHIFGETVRCNSLYTNEPYSWWAGRDLNSRSQRQQFYRLPALNRLHTYPYISKNNRSYSVIVFFGDGEGNRTPVTAVKGRCLNRLTNGPYVLAGRPVRRDFGSGTKIRTRDTTGMNRVLWPTELCRLKALLIIHIYCVFVNRFFHFQVFS